MASAVLDSSVFLRLLLPSQLDRRASALLRQLDDVGVAIAIPSQVASEVMSQLRRAVADGRLAPPEGRLLLDFFRDLLQQVYTVQWNAFDHAAQFNLRSTYDCEPYALAEALGADLWTADDRFVNAMQGKRPSWVHSLSDAGPTP